MSTHLLINASNVSSPGAVSLASSLLGAFVMSQSRFRYTLLASEEVTLATRDRWPEVEIICVPTWRVLHPLRRVFFEYRTLPALVKARKFDAVLALGNFSPKATGVPTTVLLQHLLIADTSLPAAAPEIGPVNLAIRRFLFRRTAGHTRAIIVQTAHMKRLTHENYGVPLERIHVVQNNVSPALTSQAEVTKEAISLRERDRSDSPIKLIYPTSPYAYKNVDLILRLAAQFKSEKQLPATFALTLDESNKQGRSIMERVRNERLEHIVHNLGVLDHKMLAHEYAKSTALFFPSLAESFGNPLLEAASFGLPVLAAKLPYAHDVMADSAIYFDPHDTSSAAQAIQNLHDLSKRTDYSCRAKARFESTPTWQEIGDRFLEIVSGTIRR